MLKTMILTLLTRRVAILAFSWTATALCKANWSLWRRGQLCYQQGLFEVVRGIYQVSDQTNRGTVLIVTPK